MRMDQTQRGWAFASLAILTAATILYLVEGWISPRGAHGGSALGLFFGVGGVGGFFFFLGVGGGGRGVPRGVGGGAKKRGGGVLGARKRVPAWRLGRAKSWMRGHLWVGLLSLPLTLFHGGFHFGGTLTRVLMWLLIIAVASGVYGAALQNSIPKKMTSDLPLE